MAKKTFKNIAKASHCLSFTVEQLICKTVNGANKLKNKIDIARHQIVRSFDNISMIGMVFNNFVSFVKKLHTKEGLTCYFEGFTRNVSFRWH